MIIDFFFTFQIIEIFIYEKGASSADEILKSEYNLQR